MIWKLIKVGIQGGYTYNKAVNQLIHTPDKCNQSKWWQYFIIWVPFSIHQLTKSTLYWQYIFIEHFSFYFYSSIFEYDVLSSLKISLQTWIRKIHWLEPWQTLRSLIYTRTLILLNSDLKNLFLTTFFIIIAKLTSQIKPNPSWELWLVLCSQNLTNLLCKYNLSHKSFKVKHNPTWMLIWVFFPLIPQSSLVGHWYEFYFYLRSNPPTNTCRKV